MGTMPPAEAMHSAFAELAQLQVEIDNDHRRQVESVYTANIAARPADDPADVPGMTKDGNHAQ